jgi:DNA mismatch endonuclease, patch repair protein
MPLPPSTAPRTLVKSGEVHKRQRTLTGLLAAAQPPIPFPLRAARVGCVAARAARAESLVPFKRGAGVTTSQRSKLMGRVRQTRTAPEDAVAAWLRAHKFAYRRNVRTLPGRPDFANRRVGFAIFVHGCFWHRHPGCPRTTTPSRNRDFWAAKFAANLERDAARTAELERVGLRVIIVWECESEDIAALEEKLRPLLDSVKAQA